MKRVEGAQFAGIYLGAGAEQDHLFRQISEEVTSTHYSKVRRPVGRLRYSISTVHPESLPLIMPQ
jgi:hypothetical protein